MMPRHPPQTLLPKSARGRRVQQGGGDGKRQLAIDGGAVIEAKTARLYKPKPGSAQEAVLRTLLSAQDHSDEGLLRDDMLQQAQRFTGSSPRAAPPAAVHTLTRPAGTTLQNEPQIWSSIKSSLIEKGSSDCELDVFPPRFSRHDVLPRLPLPLLILPPLRLRLPTRPRQRPISPHPCWH